MQTTKTKPFNRWLAFLLVLVMFFGLFPEDIISFAHASSITNQTYNGFELPVAGSTGYGVVDLSMDGVTIPAGVPFRILDDDGSGKLKILYGEKTGMVSSALVMINLPDVLPSIVYNATNATGSIFKSMGNNLAGITGQQLYAGKTQNARLGRSEFNMPVLYKMAQKLAKVQFQALKDGRTLILYEGFRPAETQHAVKDAMQNLLDTNSAVNNAITSWGSLTWFISTKDAGNHQKGYAVDVSMGTVTATETIKVDEYEITKPSSYTSLSMPTAMHELSPDAAIYTSDDSTTKRTEFTSSEAPILQNYCTSAGLSTLKSEWWHFNDNDAKNASGDAGKGTFEITGNVSIAPSAATSAGTPSTPTTPDPSGGGSSSNQSPMGKLLESGQQEFQVTLSSSLGGSDKIYSKNSASKNWDLGHSLGTYSGHGLTGPGYCGNHDKQATNSMTITVQDGNKSSDPVLVNTFFLGATDDVYRTADTYAKTYFKDMASAVYPELGDISGLTEDEWSKATQLAIWMALKVDGRPQLAIDRQPDFDSNAYDVVNTRDGISLANGTTVYNYATESQIRTINTAIALHMLAKSYAEGSQNVANREMGANNRPSEYAALGNNGFYPTDSVVDFTSAGGAGDGTIARAFEDLHGEGVRKQTINGKEYYVVYWMFNSKTQPTKDATISISGTNVPAGTVLAPITEALDSEVFNNLGGSKQFNPDVTPAETISLYQNTQTTIGKGLTEASDANPTQPDIAFCTFFKVCVPVDSVEDGGDVEINITMKNPGVMLYECYVANNKNTELQSYVIGDVNGSIETNGTIRWGAPAEGSYFTVYKKDTSGKALSGAVFEAKCDDPSHTITATTGADGKAVFMVPADKVKNAAGEFTTWNVTEKSPPADYEATDEVITVTAKMGDSGTYTMENESSDPPPDESILYKYDARTREPLAGAVFDFESTENGQHAQFVTDSQGQIMVNWWDPEKKPYIPPGTYKVKEVSAPKGYNIDTNGEQMITLKEGPPPTHTGPLIFNNSRKRGIRIVKVDQNTGEPLDGAYFHVWKDGKQMGDIGPTVAGEYLYYGDDPDEGLMNGFYEFEEFVAPEGYMCSNERKGVHINVTTDDPNNELVGIVFENPKIVIKLKKISSKTGQPLEGAVFDFYVDDQKLDSLVTDANGEIVIDYEKYGIFLDEHEDSWNIKFVETSPPPGCILPANPVYTAQIKRGETNAVITATNAEMPKIRIKKVSDDDEPLAGAIFEVFIDATRIDTFETDANGEIIIDYETYGKFLTDGKDSWTVTIEETYPPPGYLMPEEKIHTQELTLNMDEMVFTCINYKYPKILIIKEDRETHERLPGTTFHVFINGGDLGTLTTNENGEIWIEYDEYKRFLDEHNYDNTTVTVTEVEMPDKYNKDKQESSGDYTLTQQLKFGQSLTKFVFTDTHYRSIEVAKRDAETGWYLDGAEFTLHCIKADDDLDPGSISDRVGITGTDGNERGKFLFKDIPNGTYELYESKPPAGYQPNPNNRTTVIVTSDSDPIIYFTYENDPLTGLTVFKYDAETNQAIPGCDFEISGFTKTGKTWGPHTYTTDGNGLITLENLEPGRYTVTETYAPNPYQVDSTPRTVELTDVHQSLVLRVPNYKQDKLLIEKRDALTGLPVPGVTFLVTTAGGEKVGDGEYTTGADGTVEITGLGSGSYVVTEIRCPPDMILDPTPKTFTVNNPPEGKIHHLIFFNNEKTNLLIEKIDEETGYPLEGAIFTIRSGDGKEISVNTRTDENGLILIPNLDPGIYIIEEIKAPDGYIAFKGEKRVVLNQNETTHVIIENTKKTGITICKIDADTGLPVPGATFELYSSESQLMGTYRDEDKDGYIHIENITPGRYFIKEIKAPDGYILDDQMRYITVREREVASVTVENHAKSHLTITKIDAETKVPLADAGIKVMTMGGEVVRTGKTGTNGVLTLTDLEPGWYKVQEYEAPKGYILNDEIFTVEIKADTPSAIEIKNTAKKGLLLRKLDAESHEPLAGAMFEIYTLNDNLIGEYVTDSSGSIDTIQLAPGHYKIKEVKAPEGYLLDDSWQYFEMKEGETTKVTFKDWKQPVILIEKMDSVTAEHLAGAVFEVRTADGKTVIGMYTTDGTGMTYTLPVKPGAYQIKEIKAPDGYVKNEQPQFVNVEAGKMPEVVRFYNDKDETTIIKKTDSKTGEPLGGAVFRIFDLEGNSLGDYTTDADGIAIVPQLHAGSYAIREIQAPEGYMIDNPCKQTFVVKSGQTTYLNYTDTKRPGIQIIKMDATNGNPLAGAQFTLYTINGDIIAYNNTDESGMLVFENMEPGTYVVRETMAPKGYNIDKQNYLVAIKEGSTTIITATDTPNSNLNLKKTDEAGNPVAGAIFTVVRKSDNKTIGRFQTDSTGCLTVENLAVGEYTVTEVLAPDGYIIDTTSKDVTIAKGEQTYVSFINKRLTGIQIMKVDSNTRAVLDGATFEVTDANGNLVGSYTTSLGGIATTEPLQPGQYTIRETEAPDGYKIVTESRTVTVKTGELTKVTFENAPDTSVQVLKVDAVTNQPLSGAVFRVRSIKGEDMGNYTTGDDGTFLLNGLAAGYYILTEETAPAGYVITTTNKLISINGQGATITITNEPNPGLTIRKIDAVTKAPLSGATFDVVTRAGNVVYTGTTDESGMVQVPSIEPDYYIVRETKAPAGYTLNKQAQSVQIVSGRASILTFENQPLATLNIRKVSAESGDPLPAASFEVRSDDGTIVRTATTDATGLAFVSGLKEGSYKIREIKAPEGYMLNPTHIDFNITPGDNVITVQNYKQGGLVIRKKNKQTGELLQGARFNVESTDGNIAYTGVTDASGIILTGPLDPGTYIVREISAPEGFLLDSEPQMVEVKKDSTRTVEFEDSPLTSLLIEKIDSITRDTLAGARFKVTRLADDKVITEGVTDVDGLVLVADLEPGRYEVREIVAPDGYIQETEPIIADVQLGKVAHVTFLNTPKVGIIIDSVDSDNKKPLSGSTFEIYIQNSVKVYTLTTDNTGRVQTPALAPGFYVIKQTVVRDGYTILISEKTVEVKAGDKPVYVTFESKPSYTLRIENVDINDRNITIADAEFKVTTINGTLIGTYITDVNGQIMVPGLAPGWYVVSQTLPGQGYDIVTQTFNVEVKAGTIATVLIRSTPLTGLLINIRDQDTKDGLEGAIFEVWHQNGNLIGSFTSDKSGHIQTNIMNAGYYVIKQIKAPDGYTIINAEQTVHLDTHASQTVNFYNTINSNVTIRYEDSTTAAGIAGAIFEVSEQNGKYIGDFKTEAGGVIATQILTPGFYVIKLKAAPDGYVFVSETQTIEVRTGATTTVTFRGSQKSGLQIEVVDENNQHVEGGEFEVRTINGVLVGTYKVEFDGCVVVSDLAAGYYVIKQVKAPNGYQIDTTEKTIEIKAGAAANVSFTNIKNTGVVIYTSDLSGGNLAKGIRFEIRQQDGNVIGTYISDGTGMISVPVLKSGYYVVKILSVPDGYAISKAEQTINVTANTTVRITFDVAAQTNIKIHVTDVDTGAVVMGAKFKVQKMDGAVIGEYTTDSTGYINTDLLTEGWYTITQIEAAKGYEMAKIVMKNVQVIAGKASVVEFTNAKRAAMILRNLNKADDSPLSGAKFKLISIRGTQISDSIEINHEGIANLPELAPGYYILTQIKAPDGFSVNTERLQFRVDTGSAQTITFYNTAQSVLQIMAVDKSGTGIAGLKGLVSAMDGKKLGEYTTEKGGMVSMPKVEAGYYVVTVVSAPDGYIANEESKTVEVKAGEPAKVSFELGKVSALQIITTGGVNAQPIAGATYTIVKLNGERVGTFKSDTQGLISVNLQPDTYVVTQTSVPSGYEVDSTPRNVTVAINTATKIEYSLGQLASIRLHIVDSSTQKGIYNMRFLLKDSAGGLVGEYTTDDQGYVRIEKNLKDGYYTIEALRAPDGYTLDKIPRTIQLISGETTEIDWTFSKDAGQIQVILRSQDYNEMLDLQPESLISGAVFEIVNPDTYAVVDTIVTGEDGVAASAPMPIGRYILRQKSGAPYYAASEKEMEVKLKIPNDVVRVEYYNRSMVVSLKAEMQSNNNVTAGTSMRIDFAAINNESDSRMDDFFWQIKVPTDCARAGTLYTGTWNTRAWYKVSYKTNVSDFRQIGAELLSTNQNQLDLSATALGLQSGEYVTDIRLSFGTVPADFKVTVKPAFYLYVMPTVTNGYKCITRTEIGGKINDEWQTATATWTTNVIRKNDLPSTLPKTGF